MSEWGPLLLICDWKKKKKSGKAFSVNNSQVNYWGNTLKASGSTHISQLHSSLNSASNSHEKTISLYSAI